MLSYLESQDSVFLTEKTYKQRVKHCFNRAAQTYDLYCGFQDQVAKQLFHFGNQFIHPNACAIDLGCGTGNSTQLMSHHPHIEKLLAMDLAKDLIERAKLKSYGVPPSWLIGDFDILSFHPNTFDLIFSSMSLQWSANLMVLMNLLYAQMKPAGTLIFSIPIEGTFQELHTDRKLDLITEENLKKSLSLYLIKHFSIEETVIYFSSVQEALNSIKKIGANAYSKAVTLLAHEPAKLENVIQTVPPQLTYRIAYIVSKKEG
jgi:malonyl-CoA O-methyltransferase